jgi:hypothetical protein
MMPASGFRAIRQGKDDSRQNADQLGQIGTAGESQNPLRHASGTDLLPFKALGRCDCRLFHRVRYSTVFTTSPPWIEPSARQTARSIVPGMDRLEPSSIVTLTRLPE